MGFSKCNAPFEKKRSSIVSNKNILYFCSTFLYHPARLVSEAEWRCHVCRDAILRVSPQESHQHEWGGGRGAPTWKDGGTVSFQGLWKMFALLLNISPQSISKQKRKLDDQCFKDRSATNLYPNF